MAAEKLLTSERHDIPFSPGESKPPAPRPSPSDELRKVIQNYGLSAARGELDRAKKYIPPIATLARKVVGYTLTPETLSGKLGWTVHDSGVALDDVGYDHPPDTADALMVLQAWLLSADKDLYSASIAMMKESQKRKHALPLQDHIEWAEDIYTKYADEEIDSLHEHLPFFTTPDSYFPPRIHSDQPDTESLPLASKTSLEHIYRCIGAFSTDTSSSETL